MKQKHMPVLLILVAVGPALAGCITGRDQPGVPDATLTNSDGERFEFAEMFDRPLVLFFMKARNCAPCFIETRDVLVPLHEDVGDEANFLSLDIDPTESNRDLREFQQRLGANWTHALDSEGINRHYNVAQLSVLVVLDTDGDVVLKKVDPSKSEIKSAIERAA